MFFYLKLWTSKWSPCQNRIERQVSVVNATESDCLVETHSGRVREITRLSNIFFWGQYCRCISGLKSL